MPNRKPPRDYPTAKPLPRLLPEAGSDGLPGVRLWMMAARPRTLTLAATPVVVGLALAWAQGAGNAWVGGLILVTALLIQAGTNLLNDAADHLRGGDGPDRVGPPRVTALGLVAPDTVVRMATLTFGLAVVGGAALVAIGGWPIALLGALSVMCGWGYSAGPRPLSATPLGELFVIAFFGVAAVAGTVYLMTGGLDPAALGAGLALGLFAAAVLMVNNTRDRISDRAVGRRTLSVLLAPRTNRLVYTGLMLAPFALPAALPLPGAPWMALGALPAALALVHRFWREAPGPGYNRLLAWTALTQALYGLLLAMGILAP